MVEIQIHCTIIKFELDLGQKCHCVMHQVHKVTQWGCFNQSDDMIMVLKSKFAFGFLISISTQHFTFDIVKAE